MKVFRREDEFSGLNLCENKHRLIQYRVWSLTDEARNQQKYTILKTGNLIDKKISRKMFWPSILTVQRFNGTPWNFIYTEFIEGCCSGRR